MAQYDLPNNKKLNVPDNLDPALREKLAGAIQRQFGVDINETTVLGQAEETLKGIPRGAISLATDAVLGPASLFDIGNDSDFVQGLQQYKDFLNTESSLAADPAYRDKWMTKLGEGLGSFAPFLAAGKLGQVAKARGIGGTGVANPMFAVPAALAVPSGIAQQADRVNSSRGLGEDVGGVAETFAELGGGIVGLSEILPVFNLLKRVPKNALQYSDIRRKLSSALQSGAAEGLQEVSASLAQDLIARGLYSDELPIGDSLFDEFTIGGAVGALADLGVNAMSGRSRGRQYLYDREQQARKNVISLDEENKFQKAEAQGVVEEITDLPDVVKPDIPLPPTIIPGPQLEVIQDAAEKFAVVDLQNTDSPILQQFDTEVEALNFKNKEQTNYERKKLKVNLDNATYSLGMPNSATAYKVGATINDPNTSSINLQTLVNFDSTLSEQQKKLFSKEKIDAGFVGKNTYSVLTNETMYEVAVREFTEQMLEDTGVKINIDEQTRESSTSEMSKEFNKILEETKGVGIYDIYSDKRSKALGAKKGRFNFFIPPSAEDFVGLMYSFLSKGKVGEKQMEFFKENLIKPFGQAMQALNLAQNVTRNLYNDVRKEYKDIHKLLKKESEFKGFTYEDAARVYMWTLAGYDIPGLNRNDVKKLVNIVNNNERLKDYSKKMSSITGTEQGYVPPGENWDAGSILSDMQQESKDIKYLAKKI